MDTSHQPQIPSDLPQNQGIHPTGTESLIWATPPRLHPSCFSTKKASNSPIPQGRNLRPPILSWDPHINRSPLFRSSRTRPLNPVFIPSYLRNWGLSPRISGVPCSIQKPPLHEALALFLISTRTIHSSGPPNPDPTFPVPGQETSFKGKKDPPIWEVKSSQAQVGAWTPLCLKSLFLHPKRWGTPQGQDPIHPSVYFQGVEVPSLKAQDAPDHPKTPRLSLLTLRIPSHSSRERGHTRTQRC